MNDNIKKNIKSKKYFIIKVILFFSVIVCCLKIIENPLVNKFYTNNNSKAFWLQNIKDKHFDVLIVGASKANSGINTDLLELKCTNLTFLNAGIPQLTLIDYYLLLNVFEQNKLTFDNLVISLEPVQLLKSELIDQKNHYYFFLNNLNYKKVFSVFKTQYSYLKSFIFRSFKTLGFFYFRETLEMEYSSNVDFSITGFNPSIGSNLNNKLLDQIDYYLNNGFVDIEYVNKAYIDKILRMDYLKQKRIIIVTLPKSSAFNHKLNSFALYKDQFLYLANLSRKYDVEYYDIDAQIDLEDNKFYDHLHTNLQGTNMTTELLSVKLFQCLN